MSDSYVANLSQSIEKVKERSSIGRICLSKAFYKEKTDNNDIITMALLRVEDGLSNE